MAEASQQSFPKAADKDRLQLYSHYDKLYYGEHYNAFSIRGEKDFTDKYNKLRYVVANFAGLMSRVMADMLFGESVKIDMKDQNNQTYVDGLIEDNGLITQLYESALCNSRRGDSIFKIRLGQRNEQIPGSPLEIIIEEITPAIYFPDLNQGTTRYSPNQDVLGMLFVEGENTYLHLEKHVPGYIFHEVYSYNKDSGTITAKLNPEDFGYPASEETRVDRSLIFHIPNVRDGNFWGTSDYRDLDSLFFALNNRITKTDNILDKHSDPILAVPPGVLDEDGKVAKSSLNMFEVDNENPGFNKPEYIVWNANLEWAFKEIDKLVALLYMFSEISPASTGSDDGSQGGKAESGRALKFKLLATIRKRNRKKLYYDKAIKDIIETALELGKAWGIQVDGVSVGTPERPAIKWGDGVINDEVEQTDIYTKRVTEGISSRQDAISVLDDISPNEAKEKVKEIDAEAVQPVPTIQNNGLPANNGG